MRTLPRILPALTLALGFAACGDDGAEISATDSPTPTETATGEVNEAALEAVAQAAETTVEQGTARFDLIVESEGTAARDGKAPVSAQGEEDFANERRRFTFEGPQGELRVIVDGETAYIELPATEDEQWAELELDKLSGGDFGFGGPGGLPFQGIEDNLDFLRESATSAREAGEEDVDGVTTTRYELAVDLRQAAEDADEAEQGLRRTLEQTGVRTLDVTVWVDGQDRIARIEYALDLEQADIEGQDIEADPSGRIVLTVDYRDFGEDLQIDVPTDEQIVEIDEDELRRSFGADDEDASGSDTQTEGTRSPTPTPTPIETERETETPEPDETEP